MTCYKINGHADVVELADALASGASGSNPVRVQVPPSAPHNESLAYSQGIYYFWDSKHWAQGIMTEKILVTELLDMNRKVEQ